jgi:uncharacterized membrane protein
MNPIVATIAVSGIAWLGSAGEGEPGLSQNQIVAFFVLAVLLSFLHMINANFANALSWLAIVAAMLANIDSITKMIAK